MTYIFSIAPTVCVVSFIVFLIFKIIEKKSELNEVLRANALLRGELERARLENIIPQNVRDSLSVTRSDIKTALIHVPSIVDCVVFESLKSPEVLHVLIVSESKEEKMISDASAAVRYVIPAGLRPFIVFLSIDDFDENIIQNGLYKNALTLSTKN